MCMLSDVGTVVFVSFISWSFGVEQRPAGTHSSVQAGRRLFPRREGRTGWPCALAGEFNKVGGRRLRDAHLIFSVFFKLVIN